MFDEIFDAKGKARQNIRRAFLLHEIEVK